MLFQDIIKTTRDRMETEMNLSERANAFSIAQLLEGRQVGRNLFFNDYDYQNSNVEQFNGGMVSHKKLEEDLEGKPRFMLFIVRNFGRQTFLLTKYFRC